LDHIDVAFFNENNHLNHSISIFTIFILVILNNPLKFSRYFVGHLFNLRNCDIDCCFYVSFIRSFPECSGFKANDGFAWTESRPCSHFYTKPFKAFTIRLF
jgi:hypothetical protein